MVISNRPARPQTQVLEDADDSEAGVSILGVMYCHLENDTLSRATPVPAHLSFLNADKSLIKYVNFELEKYKSRVHLLYFIRKIDKRYLPMVNQVYMSIFFRN